MRYYYAIVNTDSYGNQICNGLIDTFDAINQDNYIRIDTFDEALLGKMWTGTEWAENPNPPIVTVD